MGYAYEWLTEKEKKNISQIRVDYDVNKICIDLTVLETFRRFVYTKDVERWTSVVDVQKKQDAWIEKYFVDVACEDLDMLVTNQKAELVSLNVEIYEEKAMDPIRNKIFDKLSNSAASRSSPLQVNDFCVSHTKVSKAMSVIRHLDQLELRSVVFRFDFWNKPGKIDDSMIDWHGDSGRKTLEFQLHALTREDLEGIASSQRFDEIVVFFKSCDEENFEAIFDTQLLHLEIDTRSVCLEKRVLIKPRKERDHPFYAEGKEKGAESELIKSSLSEKLALAVLGNSVIMENILVKLDVFDIQPLRKVCRGVRECIDNVKPDPHITAYKVDVAQHRVLAIIESNEARRIEYKCGDHALNDFHCNSIHQKTSLCESEHHALNDFHIKFLHQKTCLEKLWIILKCRTKSLTLKFATKIGEQLRRRKTALKVETLAIDSRAIEDVMQILPYIDKDFLKKIIIIHQNIFIANELSTDVVEIARTEQWNRASQLSIQGSTITTSIREMNITHFSTVDILMKNMPSGDVFYLKTELLKSSTLEKFKIKYKTCRNIGRLHNLIGEPYHSIRNVKKIWYFRMPNPDFYLHIVLDTQVLLDDYGSRKPKTIVFSKVPKEDTPFF